MSPMPKILLAILSGWKTSNWSIFSPTPINFMGTSVINFILSAAPPRPSPSTLLRIILVKLTVFLNSEATFTAIWPVKESATKIVSTGFIIDLIFSISLIIARSIWDLPAVSKIIISVPLKDAALKALFAISSGSWSFTIGNTLSSWFSPKIFNCSCAAGL